MDFPTVNRAAASLLVTVVVLSFCWATGSALVPFHAPHHPAFAIPARDEGGGALPSGSDAAYGAFLAQQNCSSCHSFMEHGPIVVGPNLWGILGRPIASTDFPYSDAISAHRGASWDAASLAEWLTDPDAFAPGTKMSFPGFSDANDRAALIAWLKTLAPPHPESPKP